MPAAVLASQNLGLRVIQRNSQENLSFKWNGSNLDVGEDFSILDMRP